MVPGCVVNADSDKPAEQQIVFHRVAWAFTFAAASVLDNFFVPGIFESGSFMYSLKFGSLQTIPRVFVSIRINVIWNDAGNSTGEAIRLRTNFILWCRVRVRKEHA